MAIRAARPGSPRRQPLGTIYNAGPAAPTSIRRVVELCAEALGMLFEQLPQSVAHQAKIGSIELSVKDRETINVPVWAGVGAIVIGGLLVLFGGKKG